MIPRIAITGGIAAGKSTVLTMMEEMGAHTVSADAIVHQLLAENTDIQEQIVRLLGEDVRGVEGIDRVAVASRVFYNEALLKQLEQILHPVVRQEIQRQWKQLDRISPSPRLFVVEIPLLFESGMESDFDTTVAVNTSDQIAQGRRGGSDLSVRAAHQLSGAEKAARADHVIVNDGTLDELRAEVKTLVDSW